MIALAALLMTMSADVVDAPLRVAIVIGNNQAPTAAQPTLLYADDDAIANAALLREAGVRVVTLTRPDASTRKLNPQFMPDGVPTAGAIDGAVERLAALVEQANRAGRRAELFVFFSGHGDVDRGEGYLVLEGGRLSRYDLHAKILERTGAAVNHVFIDACRSSFMHYARGAGGTRTPTTARFASRPEVVAAATGFVLSTSSGGNSHEWGGFTAGVFSHEVRSALRGGADVDGDGRITYAELGAFLTVANDAVRNIELRPDFLVSPPGASSDARTRALDDAVLEWPPGDATLHVDAAVGHFYVQDIDGHRIVDVPPTALQLTIRMPAVRPLFVETTRGEHVLQELAGALSSLEPRPRPDVKTRGPLDAAFEQLFRSEFAIDDVAEFKERPAPLILDEPTPARPLLMAAWAGVGMAGFAAATGLATSTAGWLAFADGTGDTQLARVEKNAVIDALNVTTTVAMVSASVTAMAAGALFVLDERDDR